MTAWTWIKEKWQWILLGLGLIGVFLAGFFSRRERIISPSQDTEDKVRKIEADAEKQEAEAAKERDEEVQELQEKRDDAVQGFQQEQEEHYEEIKDDPDEVNRWLLEVGKKQR